MYNKHPKQFSFLVILFLSSFTLFAQVPPNDLCENAITLDISFNGCTFTPYSLEEATASSINQCYPSLKDVWFTLVVPDSLALGVDVFDPNFNTEPSISIFTGDDCNELEFYSCIEGGNLYAGLLQLVISDPELVGKTLYFRMFSFWADAGNYEICVQSLDLLYSNTTCETATKIEYSGESCDPNLSITDTLRNIPSVPIFNCFLLQRDLWYEVVVPPGKIINVDVSKPNEDPEEYLLEIYTGGCSGLVLENCFGEQNYPLGGYFILSNYTSEEIVYTVRIGTEVFGDDLELILCAKEVIPAPNDVCQTAIVVEAGLYPLCGAETEIDFSAVMNEDQGYQNSCFGFARDVWFSLNDGDTLTALILNIENLGVGESEILFEMYNGDNCDDLILQSCDFLQVLEGQNEFLINLQNLPNDNWFLRISSDEYQLSNNVAVCFSIPGPEENDECADANQVQTNGTCQNFTNFGSINSSENFCSEDPDVWFKFLYETSAALEVKVNGLVFNSFNSFTVSFFRGTCNNFELIECNVLPTNNEGVSYIIHNPSFQGETIYVAITKVPFSPTIQGFNFEICVNEIDISFAPFDHCSIAKTVQVNEPGSCPSPEIFEISFNTYSGVSSLCHQEAIGNDNWLKFTAPENGRFEIDINSLDPQGFAQIKSVNFYLGNCDNPQFLACFGPGLSFSKRMNFANFANELIYVQVVSESFGFLQYDVCIKAFGDGDLVANDLCDEAQLIEVQEGTCETPFLTTNVNAFSSAISPDCAGFEGNDVWYRFTVPSSGELIIEAKAKSGSTLIDGVFALYVGTCEDLQFIACDDDSGQGNMPAYQISNPFFADAEIFLQFWAFNAFQEGEFEICLTEPEPAIADNCSDAIFVNPKNLEDCFNGLDIVSNISNSFSGVQPDCFSSISSDVWFKFEYETGQKLKFDFKHVEGSLLVDGKAALYRQGCSSLQFLACADDNGPGIMPSFDMEEIIDPAWDGDQNFYVQFWDFNQGVGGDVAYCLYEKNLVNIPNQDLMNLSISPNPFVDRIKINFDDNTKGDLNWSILNIEGKVIQSGSLDFKVSQSHFLDTQDLVPGSYVLRIISDNQEWVEKIVKI